MSWTTILGIALLLYAALIIFRGRLTSGDDYGNTTVIDRKKSPVRFWITVGGLGVLAFILIFNIFHF
jgi:uncharacterized membrane protein